LGRAQKNTLTNSNESNNNAIESLKMEVLRLSSENNKLREELHEAHEMNLKFKDFAQDLMKYYEKPVKKNENKKK